jgi:hypothetical protein
MKTRAYWDITIGVLGAALEAGAPPEEVEAELRAHEARLRRDRFPPNGREFEIVAIEVVERVEIPGGELLRLSLSAFSEEYGASEHTPWSTLRWSSHGTAYEWLDTRRFKKESGQ